MRPVLAFGFVALLASSPPARAADVVTGDGIAVVDISAAEVGEVLAAVDAAAAFAARVGPLLPAEYGAAVGLAAGGWKVVRAVVPAGVGVRVVLTAVPPAVLVLPRWDDSPAADVIKRYDRLRAVPSEAVREAAARLDAARKELAAELWAKTPADRFRGWREKAAGRSAGW